LDHVSRRDDAPSLAKEKRYKDLLAKKDGDNLPGKQQG
jgi:hypothetical protein